MKRPVDGDRVDDRSSILRLPRPPADFDPDQFRPTHLHFTPSQADIDDAARRNGAVRVSVWDESLTTIAQAAASRGGNAVVLRVRVSAVRAVPAPTVPLDVVYDALPEHEASLPGAAGHAGIEGLDRPSGASKHEYREIRHAVAEACEVVVESAHR